MVGRGDLEKAQFRTDAEKIDGEALHIIYAWTASEKLDVKSLDITNAYFQSGKLTDFASQGTEGRHPWNRHSRR